MRRPSIACQRAVQSLHVPAPHYVWVPDDFLSLAVHRFFRFPCPHQKRHGSHVPGPLEARRRASKRRMTVSAGFCPDDTFAAPFGLGALFGFRVNPQPSWRYEPPSLPQNTTPLDPPFPQTSPSSVVAPSLGRDAQSVPRYLNPLDAEVADNIINNNGARTTEAVADDVVEAPQSVAHTSATVDVKACFASFKLQTANLSQISNRYRNKRIRKLFYACYPDSTNACEYTVLVLRHVLNQGWDCSPIIGGPRSVATPPMHTKEFSELLECLHIASSRSQKSQHIHPFLKDLAQSQLLARQHGLQDCSHINWNRFVQLLWQSALSQRPQEVSTTTELLRTLINTIECRLERGLLQKLISDPTKANTYITYSVTCIANNPGYLNSIERALSVLPEQLLEGLVPAVTLDLAKAIQHKSSLSASIYQTRLDTWLRLVQGLESKASSKISLFDSALAPLAAGISTTLESNRLRPEILASAVLLKLAQQKAFKNGTASQFMAAFSLSLGKSSHDSFEDILRCLVTDMWHASLPYNGLLELSLTCIARHAPLALLLRCVTMLTKAEFPVSNVAFLDAPIAERLAKIRSRADVVTGAPLEHDRYALHMVQKIVTALSGIGLPLQARANEARELRAMDQFNHIIRRAEAACAIPSAYCNASNDMSTELRIGLAHQLAHHYAMDTTRSHRQSLRSIIYIYRYLTSNSFPMGSLFTQAIVQAMIMRPLSENRFVSSLRLIWVCKLVAQVEGENAARSVESEFFERRGALILHAKNAHVEMGGDQKDRVRIGTMKRLDAI